MNQINDRLARASCSLEGLSVGDAFGDRHLSIGKIQSRTLLPGDLRYTDDTQMALSIVEILVCTAESIRTRSHSVSASAMTVLAPMALPCTSFCLACGPANSGSVCPTIFSAEKALSATARLCASLRSGPTSLTTSTPS